MTNMFCYSLLHTLSAAFHEVKDRHHNKNRDRQYKEGQNDMEYNNVNSGGYQNSNGETNRSERRAY
jgi:hypothetical protein